LDLSLFSQTRFSAAIVAQLIIVFANIGALFFLPIFLRQVGDFSPLQSGMATLPESIVSLVTAAYTARLIGRWGHRRILLVGLSIFGYDFDSPDRRMAGREPAAGSEPV
jgi:MFS family permease